MIGAAVIDASVAVKWVVPEIDSDRARLLSQARLEAPDLLPIECANILWKKVGLGDLNERDAATRLDLLLHSPLTLVPSHALLPPALRMALDLKHPVYDCVYLALALERKLPLITADRRLWLAARRHKRLAVQVDLLADLRP